MDFESKSNEITAVWKSLFLNTQFGIAYLFEYVNRHFFFQNAKE